MLAASLSEKRPVLKNLTLSSCLGVACALAAFAVPVSAADTFSVQLQNPTTQEACSLVGSMLQVDPVTGNVSIALTQDPECGSPVLPASPIPHLLATWAKLEVIGATSVGGGTTGEGTVSLKLTTGLPTATPGVTCEPDGQSASQVSIVSGWSAPLCSNCGSIVTRDVVVKNSGTTGNGSVTFKAKCSVQDATHANLSSVVKNIASTPSITVTPGTAPTPSYCASVTELANNYGLTEAMRQTVGKVTQGLIRGDAIDMTQFNSVFGALTGVAAPGDPNLADFGFPGRDVNNTELYPKKNMYISLRFRAPNAPAWIASPGRFGSVSSAQTATPYLTAIAPCPGQFHSEPEHPMVGTCSKYSGESSFGWTLGTSGSACKLQPGATYYLNVITAHPGSLTTSGCPTTECKQKIASSHNYPIQ